MSEEQILRASHEAIVEALMKALAKAADEAIASGADPDLIAHRASKYQPYIPKDNCG